MSHPPRPILLVEDDPNDVLLIRRAFRRGEISVPLFAVDNIRKAKDYLSGSGAFGDRTSHPLPLLLMLDLKMPGGSGLELLAWIREQPMVRHIPVIILTSSNERSDVDGAYEAGCNAYLVKPVAFEALQSLLRQFGQYWLDLNVSPAAPRELHEASPTGSSSSGQDP